MRDPKDVIAQVVNGKGPKLAEILEVSEPRVYEILSTDNPYPKSKRLVRAIGQIEGMTAKDIGLIKADFVAMCDDIMSRLPDGEVSLAEMHKESTEALQARIDNRSIAERRRESLDVIAVHSRYVRDLDREAGILPPFVKTAVANRRGK